MIFKVVIMRVKYNKIAIGVNFTLLSILKLNLFLKGDHIPNKI